MGFCEEAMNINEYTTHLPVLIEAVKAAKSKKVLELGCGDGSTPILRAMDIELTTLESNYAWGEKHQAIVVPNWSGAYKRRKGKKYGVIFVDNSPWEARTEAIQAFKNSAEFIVLHDSDYYTKHLGIDFSENFKYHETYYPPHPYPAVTGPPVMLMSNVRTCNLPVVEKEYNYERVKK